jgi:hypothetical protein
LDADHQLVIGGAIFTHLTSLGTQVVDPTTGEGDGGLLFGLAVLVAVGSAVVLAFRWRQLPLVGRLSPTPWRSCNKANSVPFEGK